MKYILGVDAGNTKTIALIARLDGTIVGYGRAGCGDIYNAGSPQKALQHVDDAINSAISAAKVNKRDIVSAAFSMAGADWPEDFHLIEGALKDRRYARRLTVVNDALGALRAGAVDNWGVAIANGTGAAISARAANGQEWFSSFWQEGGGGRALGLAALRAVYKAELVIIPETVLQARILAYYKLNSVEELLHQFTKREGATLANAPGLARTVLDAAHDGDEIARQIVHHEGTTLGDYALAAARKVGIDKLSFPLILAGSIFRHPSPLLINAMLERVRSVCPDVKVIRSELEPSCGALIIAREKTGVTVSRKMRAKLKLSAPAAEVFAS